MFDEYALALERMAWLRAEAQAAHRLSQAAGDNGHRRRPRRGSRQAQQARQARSARSAPATEIDRRPAAQPCESAA
jgi:hypothetical protein